MIYPIAQNQRIEEIETIVNAWPIEKKFDQVLKWLMQFDSEDVDLGVRIIRNLNVIGFEDLNTSLSIAYSKLQRVAIDKGSKISNKNTLFAGIGDGGKSGAMIGYSFRLVNELSEENFMSDETIKHLENGVIDNIVLLDDIIGTGRQSTNQIKILTEKVTPLGVKNIFLLTAIGMTEGIKNIIDATKTHVFSAFEYTSLDTTTNLDSLFYEGIPYERRTQLKSRLEYYGKVASNAALGYGGIGALIAFYYNTPNITVPVIWGSQNSWIPLFKRVLKINGISSYYKQIDASINKKKKENKPIEGREQELILLVEGRTDEVFFDYILSTMTDAIPFNKYSVISLNGYGSKTLIDNIVKLSPNCLFVIEDDDSTPPGLIEKFKKNIGGHPHITIQPIETFIDIDRISQDEKWGRLFKQPENLDEVKSKIFIRRAVLDIYRRLQSQPSLQKEFFANYMDSQKLDNLKRLLNEKIHSIFVGNE